MITQLMMSQRRNAYSQNLNIILWCLNQNPKADLCDLGCDDGKWTLKLGEAICTRRLFGVEIIEERRKQAEANGVNAKSANLNGQLLYEDACFDIIHANQVIEHLSAIDMFLSKIQRTLKPGGYVIISTENLASWHNIFALFLGYMPFALTNATSKTAALGNHLPPSPAKAMAGLKFVP